MNGARLARAGAILIAIAAAIDPAWTRTRVVPVPVSIVYDAPSASFATQLRRDLAGEFDVVNGALPAPEASILIRARGGPLPPVPETGRVFVVDDPSRASPVRIRSIDVPRTALRGRAVTATVLIDVAEAGREPLKIELRDGDRLVAREERAIEQRGTAQVVMRFVPARTGLVPLRVDVTSGTASASAGAAVNVEDRKLRVLFVDPRPSWSSTFVRRALEQDPAFDVSADTVTSRGVSATSGQPARYDDAVARESIDAVVAGAPSALPAAAIRALESFARDRGGAVVLLADQDSARVLEQLTGAGWQRRAFGEQVTAAAPHGDFLLSEALLIAAPPLAARALATAGKNADPIVQDIAIGSGRVIVSGALDAWRYRGGGGSRFEAFWRGVIGDAALAAAQPLSVTVSPQRANPGAVVHAEVIVRHARDGAAAVAVEGHLDADGRKEPVRFWPTAAPGVFTARFAAPAHEGASTLKAYASVDGRTFSGEAPVLASPSDPLANVPAGIPIVLVSARDGAYVSDGDTAALASALRAAFPGHEAPVTVRPMRYAAWLAPFTLLLGYEWRWRRQRGLK